MDDGIDPEDSISQMTGSHASSTCRTTHSASSHGSGRSREQLNLDSALAIKMNSQEKRAQLKRNKLELEKELEKRKLEIDLDIEQNELKEQMDLAKNEMEILYENQTQDQGSSSSSHVDTRSTATRTPEQEQRLRNHPSNADINKMLDECYTFLGSEKIDGAKACRVYCPSTTSVKKKQTVKPKSIEPEKATQESQKNPEHILTSTSKAPVIGKKSTLAVPRKTFENNAQKEEIGYFPSPTCKANELPDRTSDKALEPYIVSKQL